MNCSKRHFHSLDLPTFSTLFSVYYLACIYGIVEILAVLGTLSNAVAKVDCSERLDIVPHKSHKFSASQIEI